MRFIKYSIIFFIIGAIIFLSLSCAGGSATPSSAPQTATVKRGNIVISVIGTGNLALKNTQELSFGQTGIASQATTAKLSEVNVVAGQTVKKGQVLVKADPTDWQNQLTVDQHNLDSAQAGVAQAQSAFDQDNATITQLQATLIQDQISLLNSQQALKSQKDIQDIQTKIDNDNIQVQEFKALQKQALAMNDPTTAKYCLNQIIYLSVDTNPNSTDPKHVPDGGEIGLLQTQMNNLLKDPAHAGATLVSSATAATQIQQAELAVQLAQAKIANDQANLVTAQANLVNAQNNVVLAQNKVDDAQINLTNDQNSAQEIDAPFDGLITLVNVSQGQIVQRNATLIEIADPNQFVSNVMVTERDVLSIKVNDKATVSLNVSSALNYPATITQIAPLATVQQGVVNYQVTVELTSLIPVFPANTTGQSSSTTASAAIGSPKVSGATPSGTTQTTPTPSTLTGTSGATPGTASGGRSAAATIQAVSLKDGLSTTVTIPIQEKDSVLVLPSRAITRQGQTSTVQLIKGATTVTTTITTGLTDGTNVEIVSGLNEGDQVSITPRTSSTSTNVPGGLGGLRIP